MSFFCIEHTPSKFSGRLRVKLAGCQAAEYAARRSSIRKHQTGCAVMDGSDLIALGWSHVGTRWERTPWSTHAEMHALLRARFQVAGLSVYVATFTAHGNLTYSKPCDACQSLLDRLTVSEVHYSTKEGWV